MKFQPNLTIFFKL